MLGYWRIVDCFDKSSSLSTVKPNRIVNVTVLHFRHAHLDPKAPLVVVVVVFGLTCFLSDLL
jgi:hypothetical protein